MVKKILNLNKESKNWCLMWLPLSKSMRKEKILNRKWKIMGFLSTKNTTKIKNSIKIWLIHTKVLMTYFNTFVFWTLVAWVGMTELRSNWSIRKLLLVEITMSSLSICFTTLTILNWYHIKMIKMKFSKLPQQNFSKLFLIKMKKFIKMKETWKMIFKFYHLQFLPTNLADLWQ